MKRRWGAVTSVAVALVVAAACSSDPSVLSRKAPLTTGSAPAGSLASSSTTAPTLTSTTASPTTGAPPTTALTPTAVTGVAAISAPPAAPPAAICGSTSLQGGPTEPPDGAVTVPVGDNTQLMDDATSQPGTTFWFAPGVHTIGHGRGSQIIPADDQTYVGAPGAVLDGQKVSKYAFTQHAKNVRIAFLEIRNFGGRGNGANEGVVNHDSGVGWTIEHNDIHDNAGAGAFVSTNGVLRHNCLRNNGQYGFQGIGPSGETSALNVVVDHNEVDHNNTDDWEKRQPGCGCTGGAKFWQVVGAKVTNNYVHDNLGVGLWADNDNADFLFEGNWIENNADEAIMYEISYNATIRYNTIKKNTLKLGASFVARGDTWPVPTVYISESGGEARVQGSPVIDIHHNLFEDNWSGVTVWENADRFCGVDTASACTLVPGATRASCSAGTVKQMPNYDDCRWRAKNVQVHDNDFRFDPAVVKCAIGVCGRQAIISNFGTYPSWSPYKGTVVQEAITFNQDNRWFDNHYSGPWRFTAFESTRTFDGPTWTAAPYGQDGGSSFS